MKASIRKIIVQVDEIHCDGGKAVNPPTRRALAMAVISSSLKSTPRPTVVVVTPAPASAPPF